MAINIALISGNTLYNSGIDSTTIINGSGITNTIPKFGSSSGLTNSNIFDNGSGVTVNSNLTITGSVISTNIQATSGLTVGGVPVLNSTFISPQFLTFIQGYAFDGTNHYLFGGAEISKRDSSYNVILENYNALSGVTGSTHMGDGVYLGSFLYVTVENYFPSGSTGQKILKFDATTLNLVTYYDISAQNHGCAGLTTDGTYIYIASFEDGTKLWKYSLTGTFLGTITFTTPFTDKIQGLSYYNGDFYISEQSRLSKVNSGGTLTTYLGDYPGTNSHRGEGLQVVSGVCRVNLINDTGTFANIYYFDLTTTTTAPKFSINPVGDTFIQGKLGVGLTAISGTHKAEIVGENNISETILSIQNTSSTSASGVVLKDNIGSKFFTFGLINSAAAFPATYGNIGEGFYRTSAGSPGIHMSVANTTGYIRFGNGGVERFRMDGSGRLLIGFTAATGNNNLQISGDTSINGLTVGKGNSSLSNNTVLGFQALSANTVGNSNTAIGFNSLINNTSGASNTAVGNLSLIVNTSGSFNVSMGSSTLANNTSGTNNTGIGYQALMANTTGNDNTALGLWALHSLSSGNQNIGIGVYAGKFLANGVTNMTAATNGTYLGYNTKASANGNNNEIVIGKDAIGNGSNSVTLGNTAVTKTILQGNVGIGTITPSKGLEIVGSDALINTLTIGLGNSGITTNTAFGFQVLSANTTGANNTAIGRNSLQKNTIGSFNTAIGLESLRDNTTGSSNTSFGYNSSINNTIGSNNVSVGRSCMSFNASGSNNTAIGRSSLNAIRNNNNTAIGYQSLFLNVTGTNTIGIGVNAGAYIQDGVTELSNPSQSIYLGDETRAYADNLSNEIVIGYGAIGNGSNTITLGSSATTATTINGNTRVARLYANNIDFSGNSTTSDSDLTIDVLTQTDEWYWEANFTSDRTLNIDNLSNGRKINIFVTNTNASSRIITFQARATTSGGYTSPKLSIPGSGGGGQYVNNITLTALLGAATITIKNINGNYFGCIL